MKSLILGVMLIVVLFMTACGMMPGRNKIVLPEGENVKEIKITKDNTTIQVEDERYIAELLQKMAGAQNTGRASVQDRPSGNGVIQVDIVFQEGGVSTLFLYREGGRLFLEQPYQAIFEMKADEDLADILK